MLFLPWILFILLLILLCSSIKAIPHLLSALCMLMILLLCATLPLWFNNLVIQQRFMIKDLASLDYFLGIEVYPTPWGIYLSKAKYIGNILAKAKMETCNGISTPIWTKTKLSIYEGEPWLIQLFIDVLLAISNTCCWQLRYFVAQVSLIWYNCWVKLKKFCV